MTLGAFLPPWAGLGLAALALTFGVGMCVKRDRDLVQKGRAEQAGRQARREADSLALVLDSAKRQQPRVDTAWLRAASTSGAARDSLKRARTAADSLARLLAIRDADAETIAACGVARSACEVRALTAERLADARLRELTARTSAPVVRRRWGAGATLGFGATYDLGTKKLATGPSATVGLTWSF